MNILSLILYLLVAATCAFLAGRLVPGRMPGGFLVAAIFGVIGGWIGGNVMGSLGPSLAGVALIPTIIGSAILVFVLGLFGHRFGRAKQV